MAVVTTMIDLPPDLWERRRISTSFLRACTTNCEVPTGLDFMEKWPLAPASTTKDLWLREVEDAVFMATVDLEAVGDPALDLTKYASRIVQTGTALRANLPHARNLTSGVLALLEPRDFLRSTTTTTSAKDAEGDDDQDDAAALVRCARCGGKATWTLKQTRSADEPMTQMCKCTKCGKEWRQ